MGLRRGTRAYTRAVLAMLALGLAIFNTLYSTQALLPVLVEPSTLGLSPTQAAWTVSAATGALALCVVPASILSERFGRGRVLIVSALAATALGLMLPFAPDAAALITLRALQGVLIAGTPAVAMAWLAEEIHSEDLPHAMGLYIAGNTIGGLTGRLIPAGLLELASWRWALAASGAAALSFALLMSVLLPRQRNFSPKALSFRREFFAMLGHLKNYRLVLLYLSAFLGMGAFVSLYNFIGFRLISYFGLAPSVAGLVFVMYLSGTWSSAQAGNFTKRFGRGRVILGGAIFMLLGAIATAADSLAISLVGLFIFTASFFAVHSTASGWVGAIATSHRAEASSLYTFNYYVGSSLVGAATGWVFGQLNWVGFVAVISGIVGALVLAALALRLSEKRRGA